MKNFILLLIIIISFYSMKAKAQDMGVGFVIGQPTGLALKKILNAKNAIDGGAGWDFGSKSEFNIYSDYIFNNKSALFWNQTPIDFYFGIGGRMKFSDDIKLGARAPIGLSAWNEARNLEFFGEVAPIFDIAPKSDLDLNLGFGMRFFF